VAYWDKIASRGNVEDRRGSAMAVGGGLGIVGVIVTILFAFAGNGSVPIEDVLGQLQTTLPQQSLSSQDFAGADKYETFASTVLGSNNDLWKHVFNQQSDTPYAEPKLVLFRGATRSGCGMATSQVGPHYCPADATIYIDETFFDELQRRFKAKGGDVAEAYVIAHEVGHHVQNRLGIMDQVRAQGNANQLSINLELQADCFAGVWAKSVADAGVFEPGEIQEALDAAAAVGDDRIQSMVEGQVTPETWTHGSSKQRVTWFNKGFTTGTPSSCDTFNKM
jgi:uncharacterized protein